MPIDNSQKYTMEFLWWFHLVGFYLKDMYDELLTLGVSKEIAIILTSPACSEAAKKADVLQWWHNFCQEPRLGMGKPDPEIRNAAMKYMAHYHAKWEAMQDEK